MSSQDSPTTRHYVPLTRLEKAYELLAPLAFHAAHGWEHFARASAGELNSRRGLMPPAEGPIVWFHGASAGEMSAAAALDEMLHQHGFKFGAAFTATNRAGVDYIRRSMPDGSIAGLVPWDTPTALNRAFQQLRPAMLFLIETELWPRLIYEACSRGIPVFSVSARIYARDLRRYNAIRRFFSPTLRRLTRIVAQDEIECQRFESIGAPKSSCFNGGNLKYLRSPANLDAPDLARAIGITPGEPLIVAGSIHRDEAREVMGALRRLKAPKAKVIIAPRHLSSTDFIAAEARRLGWKVRRRSEAGWNGWELLVADSMGELRGFYALATCAIIGGGFGKHGGHNPYEAVMAGAPVAFGLNFENFQSEARALTAATPEALVHSMDYLEQLLTGWLDDPYRRTKVCALQRAAVPDGSAIADRYLEALAPWLSAISA